jgi:hypothetical protein
MQRLIFVHYLANFVLDERLTGLADVNYRADVLQKHQSVVLNAIQARLKAAAARLEASQLLCGLI